jgi:hypothetical protein
MVLSFEKLLKIGKLSMQLATLDTHHAVGC